MKKGQKPSHQKALEIFQSKGGILKCDDKAIFHDFSR